MKIACIGYMHGAGGAEKQIVMLSNELHKRGHKVHFVTIAENKIEYPLDRDIKIYDLSYAEKKPLHRYISRYLALKKVLKEIKPDVTINYWFQSSYLCVALGKRITGKVIYSERGNPADDEYSGIVSKARKYAFNKIDGFVFQSTPARDYFGDILKSRSIIIPNSVDIPDGKFLEPSVNREKRIVSVGRLHPQKNQKILIEAFNIIKDEIKDYILEIYGEGPLREELQYYIDKNNLDNRVFLRGTTNDVFDKIYNSSLFVLSSDYEGMPNALLEALAIGVPSISTDYSPGGVTDLIEDGTNGFITPRDDANSLAKKMLEIINNNELSEKFANNSIEKRKTHSSKTIFDNWERFIRELK